MIITKSNEWQLYVASDINALLKPLAEQTGIDFFSHVRIHEDGSRTDLTNHPEINKNYYDPKLKLFEQYIPEANYLESSDAIYLGDPENDPTVQMMKAVGSVTHVFAYIDEHDLYTDIFNFAMPIHVKNPFDIYMNNLPAIKLFQYDFLAKMGDKLKLGKLSRIILPKSDIPYEEKRLTPLHEQETDWSSFPANKRIFIGKGANLTLNELLACQELYNGNSPARIAIIMKKSQKYINKLLLSSQQKLNAKDNYHLVAILHKLVVFSKQCVL